MSIPLNINTQGIGINKTKREANYKKESHPFHMVTKSV